MCTFMYKNALNAGKMQEKYRWRWAIKLQQFQTININTEIFSITLEDRKTV